MENSKFSSVAVADHVVGRRVVTKTINSYKSKLKTLQKFLSSKEESHRYLSANGDIILPLPVEIFKEFFGWLSINAELPRSQRAQNRREVTHLDEGVQEDSSTRQDLYGRDIITISFSCMQGYRSALLWLYQEKGIVIGSDTLLWLNNFTSGYKKTIADKKSRGVMSISEGKSPLSFHGYKKISEFMMKLAPESRNHPWSEVIFSWSYMTLSWNLMARAESVGNIMLQHLDWRDDSLLVTFAKHKGDQTGEGMSNEKHIYANPLQPEICPILALAVYVFCTPRSASTFRQQLYLGMDSPHRFSRILQRVLTSIPEGVSIGSRREDIGTHSNRKGSASYALDFPDISAVQCYLRAGWSLGNVPDRYIVAGTGGDQLIGRAVSGLPLNDSGFSILPPHFSEEDSLLLHNLGWENVLSGYNNYPSSFKRVIPFLFASIVYHYNWLKENLCMEHPVRSSAIVTSAIHINNTLSTLYDFFREKVIVCCWKCDKTGMIASGIPPNLKTAIEVNNLTKELATLRNETENLISDAVAKMISCVDHVPESVKNTLLDNFRIEGLQAITRSDISAMMQELRQDLRDEISRLTLSQNNHQLSSEDGEVSLYGLKYTKMTFNLL